MYVWVWKKREHKWLSMHVSLHPLANRYGKLQGSAPTFALSQRRSFAFGTVPLRDYVERHPSCATIRFDAVGLMTAKSATRNRDEGRQECLHPDEVGALSRKWEPVILR